ncbi:MAG TPA: ABATE domain-containing protein [Bryobacteraceae bacterium]|nr:ABATE domain-containing protein [Bryobacteraceae bacterium]
MVTEYHVKFIGGRLCLDFVNTVGGRTPGGGVIRDKLAGYHDLLAWGWLSGDHSLAPTASFHPRQGAAVFRRAIRLREALYRIFDRLRTGHRPAARDIDRLRVELDKARANQRLAAHPGGFAWTLFPGAALDRVLWPVALSAAELLTSADLPKLRQCAGPDCGWLFLDVSRNRRRRWCDMQDCGNRAKVRRFRTRRRP